MALNASIVNLYWGLLPGWHCYVAVTGSMPIWNMKRKSDYLDYYRIANTYCKKLIELKARPLPDYATVFMNENKYH